MRNIVIMLLFLLSGGLIAEERYDSIVIKIQSIQADTLIGKNKLDFLREEIGSEIVVTPNNPWLWYALGDLEWKYIGTLERRNIYDQDGNISVTTPIDSGALKKQKDISFDAYDKAFQYHSIGSPKLDVRMLRHLQNVSRDIDIRVDIHRTIMREGNNVENLFGPNNTKIEFRRGLVSSLIKAKRYDQALGELDKIELEFPDDNNHSDWRTAFTELIDNGATTW